MVSWHPVQHGPNAQSSCWEMGVSLRPEFRGRCLGRAGHGLLVDHLFASTDARRLEAHTDVQNAAERAVLARVGCTLEGVLRDAPFRRGSYHDLAVYSRLRDETQAG